MSIFDKIQRMKPERRQTLIRWICFDALCAVLALYVALSVSANSAIWPLTHCAFAVMVLTMLASTLGVLAATKVYSIQIRYISPRDVIAIRNCVRFVFAVLVGIGVCVRG